MTNVDRARTMLRALETRDGTAPSHYAPDVVQREFPNRLVPDGATRDLAALRSASERGKHAVSDERYEVMSAIEGQTPSCRGHSDRSASMTSTRAARAAGRSDATTATASRMEADATIGRSPGIRTSTK